MKYELKISAEDKHIKEICRLFWKMKSFEDKYEFEKRVRDIAEEKKLSTSQIAKVIQNYGFHVQATRHHF